MILHTLNKTSALAKCSNLIAEDDLMLLMEDGVYLALQGVDEGFALKADVEARGIADRMPEGIRVIDYDGFVSLTAEADKVCAWF